MLSLVIVALAAIAIGFIIWANDRRHGKYGIVLPAGVATATAMLSWIAFILAGFGYLPGLTWIPWVLPIALGTLVALGAVWYLGSTRTKEDTHKLTQALKL
jgi:putative exporter of polyketide antibiotics